LTDNEKAKIMEKLKELEFMYHKVDKVLLYFKAKTFVYIKFSKYKAKTKKERKLNLVKKRKYCLG